LNQVAKVFSSQFIACKQRIEKLQFSLNRNRSIFPLDTVKIEALTETQEESIDALILRYSQCVSMIQDHLFRGVAYLEQEDLSDKSNRDRALLMEKLGAIKSAEAFGTAALLRNKFSHHYPEQVVQRVERLNLIIEESEYVLQTFDFFSQFVTKKQYI
jgi:hypothetical protein